MESKRERRKNVRMRRSRRKRTRNKEGGKALMSIIGEEK
jgi:hypothetical protein